eukprot:CAMPEP_0167813476 /NCGR_PEP_ID=MMETSP0112_2-20121227/1876_1 /TAXON_ID=91324 /ORGANISM="Lotharella globosa, Strain CCCM811" /LENGTH=139 /DNA_ID=CAMNT_0007712565 /DNA_START=580 /DNA_END=1000 /DNA_ORIENTATION=-
MMVQGKCPVRADSAEQPDHARPRSRHQLESSEATDDGEGLDANDYEELLRLDEGLHASEGLVQQQIDRFPKSTYKATDSKGKKAPPTCSVCLETLVNGDELRTIPCMHSFHVHCIDTWLRTKPNCPVCMYPVLQADSQM